MISHTKTNFREWRRASPLGIEVTGSNIIVLYKIDPNYRSVYCKYFCISKENVLLFNGRIIYEWFELTSRSYDQHSVSSHPSNGQQRRKVGLRITLLPSEQDLMIPKSPTFIVLRHSRVTKTLAVLHCLKNLRVGLGKLTWVQK